MKECRCKDCREFDAMEAKFRKWLRQLDEDVIQGEFGYEDGEFTVYPSHWRQLFKEGLTPREAWQRALDGFREQRMFDAATRAEQYVGILMHDAAAIAEQKSSA